MNKLSKDDPFGMKSLSQAKRLAEECLSKYIQLKSWKKLDDIVIDVQEIYDFVIYPEYEVSLVTNVKLGEKEGEDILGVTVVTENVIYIDQSIASPNNDCRYSLILAHEIGHALLHNESDQNLKYTPNAFAMFDDCAFNELQADTFAETLVMFDALLHYRLTQKYGAYRSFVYNGPGKYCINKVDCHIESLFDFYQCLAEPLTPYFSNVPVEDLGRRMEKMRFIKDKTNHKKSVFNNVVYRKKFMTKQTIGAFQALTFEKNRLP
jgi:Zn-dependent peptidase ImmA (M78 family)